MLLPQLFGGCLLAALNLRLCYGSGHVMGEFPAPYFCLQFDPGTL